MAVQPHDDEHIAGVMTTALHGDKGSKCLPQFQCCLLAGIAGQDTCLEPGVNAAYSSAEHYLSVVSSCKRLMVNSVFRAACLRMAFMHTKAASTRCWFSCLAKARPPGPNLSQKKPVISHHHHTHTLVLHKACVNIDRHMLCLCKSCFAALKHILSPYAGC